MQKIKSTKFDENRLVQSFLVELINLSITKNLLKMEEQLDSVILTLDRHYPSWNRWDIFSNVPVKTSGTKAQPLKIKDTPTEKLIAYSLQAITKRSRKQCFTAYSNLNKKQKSSMIEGIAINYCLKQLNLVIGDGIIDIRTHEKAFIYGKEILEGESESVEFKNYKYPIREQALLITLRKLYCAFLNKKGGSIFIGINETKKQFKRTVEGIQLKDKQALVKNLRKDVERHIYPEMDEYVDIRFFNVIGNPQDSQSYIARIDIRQGDPTHLYHTYEGDTALFVIRNHHENIRIFDLHRVQDEMFRRNGTSAFQL